MIATPESVVLRGTAKDPEVRTFFLDPTGAEGSGRHPGLTIYPEEFDRDRDRDEDEDEAPLRSIGPFEPVRPLAPPLRRTSSWVQDDEDDADPERQRRSPLGFTPGPHEFDLPGGISVKADLSEVVGGVQIAKTLSAVLPGDIDLDLWGLEFDLAKLFTILSLIHI